MKTKSFLLSTLVTFMFAGCSSDDAREGNIPSGELNGKAYLSLSLQSHTSTTRAENVVEKPGSSGESKAGTVRVLLFDEEDVCLDVVNFDDLTVGNSGGESGGTGTPEAVASDAKLVPEKTKKVFVVIEGKTAGVRVCKAGLNGRQDWPGYYQHDRQEGRQYQSISSQHLF